MLTTVAVTVLLLLPLLVVATATAEYCVHAPDGAPNSTCKNESCLDLPTLARNGQTYFTNNTVFNFQKGTHFLPEDGKLIISFVSNLTLQGMDVETNRGFHETITYSTAVIRCPPLGRGSTSSGIVFLSCANVTIRMLTIADCGATISPLLNWRASLFIERVSLAIVETKDVYLEQVSVHNGSGYGLAAVNAYGITINSSSFSLNNLNAYYNSCKFLRCRGGNAAILFTNPPSCPKSVNWTYQVNILNSNFSFGVDLSAPSGGIATGGLGIFMEQTNGIFGVDVTIDSVTAHGNTGMAGANIGLNVMNSVIYYTATIRNTLSQNGNMIYQLPEPSLFHAIGGGLLVTVGISTANGISNHSCATTPNQRPENPLAITNCNVLDNQALGGGSGIMLRFYGTSSPSQYVSIQSCNIKRNIGLVGMGAYVENNYAGYIFGTPMSFLLKDVNITNNIPCNFEREGESNIVTVYVGVVHNLTMDGVRIVDNRAKGMDALNTGLIMTGAPSVFQNNTSTRGGGLALHGDSYLILKPHVEVYFINNRAETYGGAIYVEKTFATRKECFFQLMLNSSLSPSFFSSSRTIPKVHFQRNSAMVAGSVLYGGEVDTCLIQPNARVSIAKKYNVPFQFITPTFIFNTSFQYHDQTESSVISSEAERICFCSGGVPDCGIQSITTSVYPGQAITVSVATLGQRNGFTSGVLQILEKANGIQTGKAPVLQQTNAGCFNLSTVFLLSPNNIVNTEIEFELSVHTEASAHTRVQSIAILVDARQCPVGFQLSSQSHRCECLPGLSSVVKKINCDITTQGFERRGYAWIGYDNTSNCIIYNRCPCRFCNPAMVSFNMTNTNPQCAQRRSGVLCGGCQEGFSMLLGTNNCGKCTSVYLTLIIPMVLAGFALVALLVTLNMTVSVGAINGLIFYANIIKSNELTVFPNGPIPVLSQFIAWLNLDLGIEVCFYDGMDAYAKTWLQFVFPVYICFMAILIIFLCRFSPQLTKLVGTNIVPVLATLFLLSYNKLLRNVILALKAVALSCGQNTRLVWFFDGNLSYFANSHLLLMGFVLVFLVIFGLPYTLVLLFSRCIEGPLSGKRRFRWLFKVKPFFDAYNGPFKDKCRFWTGFLLLARLVIALVIAYTNTSATQGAIITTVAILVILALCYKGVYRQHYLNILECFFFINLIILHAFLGNGKSEVASILSITLVLIAFVFIISYHLIMYCIGFDKIKSTFKMTSKKERSMTVRKEKKDLLLESVADQKDAGNIDAFAVSYRESVLDEFDGEFI